VNFRRRRTTGARQARRDTAHVRDAAVKRLRPTIVSTHENTRLHPPTPLQIQL